METEPSNEYSINWKNHMNYVRKAFDHFFTTNELTDVTLCCEGKKIGAHKMLLSACSAYFRETFKDIPCQHPVIILYGIQHSVLLNILDFIYNGEVTVDPSKLEAFLMVAQQLQINGLNDQLKQNQNNAEMIENSENEEKFLIQTDSPQTSTQRTLKRTKSIEDELLNEKIQKQEDELSLSSSIKFEPSEIVNFDNQSSADEELNQFEIQENEDDDLLDFDFSEDPLQTNEADSYKNDVNKIYILDYVKDFEKSDSTSVSTSLPGRSQQSLQTYELVYERFMKWCEQKFKDKTINENVLVMYFKHLSTLYKPTSLCAFYSMLRNLISEKNNLDIKKYHQLSEFLKEKLKGYKPAKTKLLSREDITRFLQKADDNWFLMTKVALIVGLLGRCARDELTNLRLDNVHDEGNVFRFVIPTKSGKTRQFVVTSGTIPGLDFIEILRKYIALRPRNIDHVRFFVAYRNGKCTKQPVGKNTLGAIPKIIASFLKLPNPKEYTSLCFRKSSNSLHPTL